jgi:hypothetical protein
MSQVLETCSIQVIWISIDFIINDFSSIIFSVIHLRSYSFPLVFFFFDKNNRKTCIKKKKRKAKVQKGSTHPAAKIRLVAVKGTKTLPKEKQGRLHITKRKTRGPIHSQLSLIMVH